MNFFKSLFNRKSAPLFGLDISAHNIKLVELSQTPNGELKIERCGIESLDHGWVVDGSIENHDEVSLALKRLIKRTGTKTKNVVMALAPSAVVTKKMMVSADLTDKELEEQVEAEANLYIPFALEEASLDFCKIDNTAESKDDAEVIIVATRKEKVQDREALAESAGLNLKVVDVESYAARRALTRVTQLLSHNREKNTVALFDIGTQSSSMLVLQGNNVLYEREQPFGTAQLLKLIVRQYGLTLEEAVHKQRTAELPSDYKESVLKPFISSLSNEIGRALQFFFSSSKYNRIDSILISGEVSNFPWLTEAITQQTSLPCSVANPFEGMQMGIGIREKKLSIEAPAYLTACGLAMRRFVK